MKVLLLRHIKDRSKDDKTKIFEGQDIKWRLFILRK